MSKDTDNKKEKLLQLVQEAVAKDKALRDKLQIGDKFRFIRDRLHALLQHVEESLKTVDEDEQRAGLLEPQEDEMLVYIYLFNAQGITLSTWHKMLHPSVFYEYSVNRPIYIDRSHIEAFIRSRPSKVQHAYITMIVKKSDVLPEAEAGPMRDLIGHPLIKIKEGKLNPARMVLFRHNDVDYVLNERGVLERKD